MKNLKLADLRVGMLVNHPLDSFHTNQRVMEIKGNEVQFMYFPEKKSAWDRVNSETTFILVQR